MLVIIAAVAIGATRHPTWPVVPLAVLVVAPAVLTTPVVTVGASVLHSFLVAGFVVGRQGQVTVSTTAVHAAESLVLTAVVGVAVVVAVRRLRTWHRTPAVRPVVRGRVEGAGAGLPG